MKSKQEGAESGEFTKPPFLYEIRVKGRLSDEQWTSWFDHLTIATAGGETTLRGQVPDHAALYALLARLRDLAIPLVAVKVLDAEAQRRLYARSRRYGLMVNLLLVAAYMALLGGLSAITVLVAPIINVALALALLFASLGGLAHVFWLWSGQAPWRWVAYLTWPVAAITLLVFIPVSRFLPPALGIGVMLFLGAGGLIYLAYELRRRAESLQSGIVEGEHPGSASDPGAEAPRRDAAAEAHDGNG